MQQRRGKMLALAQAIDPERAAAVAGRLAPALSKGTNAHALGTLLATAYPALDAWIQRLHARPAYKEALERGGAYRFAS